VSDPSRPASAELAAGLRELAATAERVAVELGASLDQALSMVQAACRVAARFCSA